MAAKGKSNRRVGDFFQNRFFFIHKASRALVSSGLTGAGDAGSTANASLRQLKPLETVQLFLDAGF
jgi:hypothetical protein